MFAASKTASVSGGYQISRSLRFNSADASNLSRTPAGAGNRTTWTYSVWLKRSGITLNYEGIFSVGNGTDQIRFENTDTIKFLLNSASSGDFTTTQVFRDPSSWYHIVVAVDTTQATSTNRVKIYVNGSQVTSFSTATYPTQNYQTTFNSATDHRIAVASTSSYYLNGYQTEVNFIDGTQLTPSSFGETNAQTGVWQPKAYSGSYGTNGFYLNFSDNSNTTAATLGKDYSGNGNNWTPNNFSVTAGAGNDSLVDSPTSYGTDTGVGGTVRGNYATLNPLNVFSSPSIANGNLETSTSGTSVWKNVQATIGVSSDKFYWESTMSGGGTYYCVGVAIPTKVDSIYATGEYGIWMYDGRGYKIGEGGSNSTPYGPPYGSGDVIGIALDLTAGTITFYKNGTSHGVAFNTGLTGVTVLPQFGVYYNGATNTQIANFGQRPFAYTAPSGYKALCTQNLPTPTIGATTATQAGKYFNPVLYTGNGASQSITGVGFQPDMTWIKARSTTYDHQLTDSVRGVGIIIHPNLTNAEFALNTVTSFNSDGFTVNGSVYSGSNASGQTYVGWSWKANGAGSSNTSGSITSTVSANTTSGFSIATYTGNGTTGTQVTVGHGLGVAPKMIFIKDRSNSNNWVVYTTILGSNKYLYLNVTDGANNVGPYELSPTSSVFYIQGTETNASAHTYVAYSFAEVAGYSKMGSYTGNGSSDGPFIYTGFRPAYVMIKATSAIATPWVVKDKLRAANYNPQDGNLYPNLSNAEDTTASVYIDLLSNGFKIRGTYAGINNSGSDFIFMAFAENPFKTSLAR